MLTMFAVPQVSVELRLLNHAAPETVRARSHKEAQVASSKQTTGYYSIPGGENMALQHLL